MEKEIWKTIEKAKNYEISNFGRIRHRKTSNVRKSYCRKLVGATGKTFWSVCIVTVNIGKKQLMLKVHREVAIAFIPNPENKPTVNHIDGNRRNNKVDNLEWATYSENMQHAYNNSLNDSTQRSLLKSDLETIYSLLEKGYLAQDIAKLFDIPKSTITDIINGKTYKKFGIDFSKFSKSYYVKKAIDDIDTIKQLLVSGLSKTKIAKQYNISRRTLNRLLK